MFIFTHFSPLLLYLLCKSHQVIFHFRWSILHLHSIWVSYIFYVFRNVYVFFCLEHMRRMFIVAVLTQAGWLQSLGPSVHGFCDSILAGRDFSVCF